MEDMEHMEHMNGAHEWSTWSIWSIWLEHMEGALNNGWSIMDRALNYVYSLLSTCLTVE